VKNNLAEYWKKKNTERRNKGRKGKKKKETNTENVYYPAMAQCTYIA
jgi:hypothetical protein